MLNYRKKEALDLLVEEILTFAQIMGIDGI
jgi:hypothetical protein